MKTNTLKYITDVALFIDMCSIAVIGLLLGFVIPQGRVPASEKYFLGLHRHQWGDIHLYLSLLLLIVLVFHVWLNWAWVVNMTRRYFPDRGWQFLFAISCGWIVVLFVGWLAAIL